MSHHNITRQPGSLGFIRLMMVVSGMSPLFILWAARGIPLISDRTFLSMCAAFILVPNFFLWWRFATARKEADKRTLAIGRVEDHRDHLLVYLFSMLLPFYNADPENMRQIASVMIALAFIIFLFWHLHLHYMNILFAVMGFRIYTVYPNHAGGSLADKAPFVVITKRSTLEDGISMDAYRLSDTVYIEVS